MRKPSCVSNDLTRLGRRLGRHRLEKLGQRLACGTGGGCRDLASFRPACAGSLDGGLAAAASAAALLAIVQQHLARAAKVLDRHRSFPATLRAWWSAICSSSRASSQSTIGLADRAACRSRCTYTGLVCDSASALPVGDLENARAAIQLDSVTRTALGQARAAGFRRAWACTFNSFDHAAVDDQLHVGDRRRLAAALARGPARVRGCGVACRDGVAGQLAVDVQQHQRPGGHEAAALGGAGQPILETSARRRGARRCGSRPACGRPDSRRRATPGKRKPALST